MTLIFRLIIQRDIWIFHSKVFSPVYELNSDLCIVSSYKYIEIRKSDLVAQFLYAICWTKP